MDAVLKVRIEGEGVTAGTWSWPQLRDFMDTFIPALAAMPGGPRPTEVVLLRVAEGSVVPCLSVPASAVDAARALARGPKRGWSVEQRQRVEPFYAFTREHKATVSIGQRRFQPVVVPDSSSVWTLREHGEVRGRVHSVGGRALRAKIEIPAEGIVPCDGEAALICALGAEITRDVYVEGVLERDAATGALLGMQMHRWRQAPQRRSAKEALRAIRDLVGPSLDGFDVEAYVGKLRA